MRVHQKYWFVAMVVGAAVLFSASAETRKAPVQPPPAVGQEFWIGIPSEHSNFYFGDVDLLVTEFSPYGEPIDRFGTEMAGVLGGIVIGASAAANGDTVPPLRLRLESEIDLRWNPADPAGNCGGRCVFIGPELVHARINWTGEPGTLLGCSQVGALFEGCTNNGVVYRKATILGR